MRRRAAMTHSHFREVWYDFLVLDDEGLSPPQVKSWPFQMRWTCSSTSDMLGFGISRFSHTTTDERATTWEGWRLATPSRDEVTFRNWRKTRALALIRGGTSSLQRSNEAKSTNRLAMSVVYFPRCYICGWTMRVARVCERERVRLRVLQCARCHAELMWTPGLHDPANRFSAATFRTKAEEPAP
jgi:hypothetical protein